ncbi:MAG: hypothetical protein V4508_21930 [Pseudomonadota bacterium]
MAVSGVSSNNVAAAPAPRQQEAKPVVDRPAEQAPAPAPQPAPVINTSGQTTGTTINTSA